MQCSVCRKQPATLALKHVVNGEQQDMHVCQACAAQHGLDAQLPIPLLTDMLMGAMVPAAAPKDDQACGSCHMHQADFQKTSLLGCQSCYDTFRTEIDGLISTMHRGVRHVGKVPKRRMAGYVCSLERAIADADPAHDGEAIARLRGQLRRLVRAGGGIAAREAKANDAETGL
ncbi:MAG: hypothetical protein O3B24_02245 [Verrucomicrobia bacterium]|nr:hypothetical protein [Verrucomicrobiota bacterium]